MVLLLLCRSKGGNGGGEERWGVGSPPMTQVGGMAATIAGGRLCVVVLLLLLLLLVVVVLCQNWQPCKRTERRRIRWCCDELLRRGAVDDGKWGMPNMNHVSCGEGGRLLRLLAHRTGVASTIDAAAPPAAVGITSSIRRRAGSVGMGARLLR